jgi:hypothetical protein
LISLLEKNIGRPLPLKTFGMSQEWWCMPVIPGGIGRLRQEEDEFEDSMSYTARTCFKVPKKKKSRAKFI